MISNLRYGPCQGGPYDKKNIAHHGDVRRIAFYRNSGKAIPAMVDSDDPEIDFGEYRWSGKVWLWVG